MFCDNTGLTDAWRWIDVVSLGRGSWTIWTTPIAKFGGEWDLKVLASEWGLITDETKKDVKKLQT